MTLFSLIFQIFLFFLIAASDYAADYFTMPPFFTPFHYAADAMMLSRFRRPLFHFDITIFIFAMLPLIFSSPMSMPGAAALRDIKKKKKKMCSVRGGEVQAVTDAAHCRGLSADAS
jgi:hypothetical protein